MTLDPNAAIGEIVRRFPKAADVFDRFQIDYCCGGTRPFAEACRRAGANWNEVSDALAKRIKKDAAQSAPATGEFDERDADLPTLIDHVLEHHHAFTRRAFAEIAPLLAAVIAAHKRNHPALEQVAALVEALKIEIEPHLLKEENLVFPQLLAVARRRAGLPETELSLLENVRHALRVMQLEHTLVGDLLRQLRRATDGYRAPADGCATWVRLCQWLGALDADLIRHIHLENNCIFPMAEAMERALDHSHASAI